MVEATAISGPEAVYKVYIASREMVEPKTLAMAIVVQPLLLASLKAANVSAVSPDCETKIHNV